MYIDKSEITVVCVCDKCNWREIRPTSAAAWTALAIHVKKVHGATDAVGRVQRAANKARNRALARENRKMSRE